MIAITNTFACLCLRSMIGMARRHRHKHAVPPPRRKDEGESTTTAVNEGACASSARWCLWRTARRWCAARAWSSLVSLLVLALVRAPFAVGKLVIRMTQRRLLCGKRAPRRRARRAEKELDVVGIETTETTGGEVVRQDSSINTRGTCVARGDVRDRPAQYGPRFVRT